MVVIKGKLLEAQSVQNNKTGEVFGSLSVLTRVLDFGQIKPKVVDVRCNLSELEEYSKLVGKDVDIPCYASISFVKTVNSV